MAKLYPPGLNGTLPAFTNLAMVTIPFIPNKTIGNNENFISGFRLILRNVTNNTIIGTFSSSSFNFIENKIIFDCTKDISNNDTRDSFKIGHFYRAQLAYIDTEGVVGYYSTVGIIKYTSVPKLSINGLEQEYYNQARLSYVGVYQNDLDSTEKVYSYRFTIKDDLGNLFFTSGDLIHNHSYDTELNESTDEFKCEKEMKLNENYFITYSIQTTNGLVCNSYSYPIKMVETEVYSGPIELEVTLDEENAYVQVEIKNTTNKPVTGNFSITRACSKDDYSIWHEIQRIGLNSENFVTKEIFKDFTIEHGYGYKYAIQQCNKHGYYSEKSSTNNEIFAKFEHIYIYDGEKQLKIKYNPKVDSMKIIQQETKQDTIGSKYPYFIRNGNIFYKEFPIGGLISYLADEQELFVSDNKLFKEDFQLKEPFEDRFSQSYDKDLRTSLRNTSLTDSNIKAEKTFRDEVLKFLTNGKYKIFKSPTEGNCICYIMNTSLSPKTEVNRMIWEFSATVYECMDYTYENLYNYNFLTQELPVYGTDKIKTIMTNYLVTFYNNLDKNDQLLFKQDNDYYLDITYGYDIYGLSINNASPGTKYYIDGNPIIIGVSGQYSVDFERKISSLKVVPTLSSGFVTFRYKQETYNPFNIIYDVSIEKLPIFKQVIGKRHITEELDNPLDILEDFSLIRLLRRTKRVLYVKKDDLEYEIGEYNTANRIDKIFKNDDNQVFYEDLNCTQPFDEKNFLHTVIYEIRAVEREEKIIKNISNLVFYLSYEEKTFPRMSYYYQRLDESSSYSDFKDREINIKWDWSRDWDVKNKFVFNEKATEFDNYIKNPVYEKVALMPFSEKEQYQKDYYENLGKISKENFVEDYYYTLSEGKYVLAEEYAEGTEYYKKHFYLTRRQADNVNTIFFEESDYNDYYLNKIENKIFIAPCQYDCKTLLGLIMTKTTNNENDSTTETYVERSIIDVDKDIYIQVANISDVEIINTGWGVICEFMYHEKRRLYGFDNYDTINPDKNINNTEDYVKYVNRLSDLIYFYSIGDLENGGDSSDS